MLDRNVPVTEVLTLVESHPLIFYVMTSNQGPRERMNGIQEVRGSIPLGSTK